MTQYYAVATDDPDDINMVAGLIKLGVLVEEPDVHHYDYCDHEYCHDECISQDYLDEAVTEAVDEKEVEILENLDEQATTTVTLEDAGCGCHSKVEGRDDGLIDVRAGEYYLINTDRNER